MECCDCEVDSREARVDSGTWQARDMGLLSLTRALGCHVHAQAATPLAHPQATLLPLSTQASCTDSAWICCQGFQPQAPSPQCCSQGLHPQASEASGLGSFHGRSYSSDLAERSDSRDPMGIAQEAMVKAAWISGAKGPLSQGLVVWLAAQVEEKVFSGAASLDCYVANVEAVAKAVTDMSAGHSRDRGGCPVTAGAHGAAQPLGTLPVEVCCSQAPAKKQKTCQSETCSADIVWQPPEQSCGPPPPWAATNDIMSDVAWARHQELRGRYLLHLQVCHLAALTRIQEHQNCSGALEGSTRAARVLLPEELRMMTDLKRMSLALVRFFAAKRDRIPARFTLEKLACLESESISALAAMQRKCIDGTLNVPVVLLRWLPVGNLVDASAGPGAASQLALLCNLGQPSDVPHLGERLAPACQILQYRACISTPGHIGQPVRLGLKRPWCQVSDSDDLSNPELVRCPSSCQSVALKCHTVASP